MATIKKGTYRFNDDASPIIHLFDKYNQTEVDEVFNLYSFPIEPVSYPVEEGDIIVHVSYITPLIAYEYTSPTFGYEVTQIQKIVADGYGEFIGTSDTDIAEFTIPTDTEVSTEVATWFNDHVKPVLKKFTRLYIGNTVASSGGKCFKRLTMEEQEQTADGIFDANGLQLASWSTLTNDYGWDVERDYSDNPTSSGYYGTTESSPSYILNNNTEFSTAKSIIIPNGVTKVGSRSFRSCGSLKSIAIPASVTQIGRGAFGVCNSLESIIIPDGVTKIDWYTFTDCGSLKSIIIPASVTSICEWAFSRCYALTDIIFKGTVSQWKSVAKKVYVVGDKWNSTIPATEVICSDGTVTL